MSEELDARWVTYLEPMRSVQLNEGDVLVIKCQRKITQEQADLITGMVKRFFPGHEVMILSPDLDLGVVTR